MFRTETTIRLPRRQGDLLPRWIIRVVVQRYLPFRRLGQRTLAAANVRPHELPLITDNQYDEGLLLPHCYRSHRNCRSVERHQSPRILIKRRKQYLTARSPYIILCPLNENLLKHLAGIRNLGK